MNFDDITEQLQLLPFEEEKIISMSSQLLMCPRRDVKAIANRSFNSLRPSDAYMRQ